MNAERPTVSPDLLAAIIEATPDRIRRRLDREAEAASGWAWEAGESAWSVATGGETVTLPHGCLTAVEQLSCTCLLSPRCFHVLACLTRLEVDAPEETSEDEAGPVAAESVNPDDLVEPSESQRDAARNLVAGLEQLLRVGVACGGVVVQSGLLRAVHQGRAEGLHRLAALGLRVLTGTRECRSRAQEADPAQLAEDVADLLETGRHLILDRAVAEHWLGTGRRPQRKVRPGKLRGLFAEPILTRSGFAGAAVYFLGDDDRIYTAADVRVGGADLARDAYRGGLAIGSLILPAKQLARGLYVGADLTASADGRLGRGQGVRIAEQGPSLWQDGAIASRFRRPLADQWDALYAYLAIPTDARPAGWDFVFLDGTILGADGPEVLFRMPGVAHAIRLAIAQDVEELAFRENLGVLARAPGLRLQVIGRVDPKEPGVVFPLAVAGPDDHTGADDLPRLELPEPWYGRACLGFDAIPGQGIGNVRPAAGITSVNVPPIADDPLGPLRRRWIAAMLAGLAMRRLAGGSPSLASETAALRRGGYPTGAALLEALSRTPLDGEPTGPETFLAAALYLRACTNERARVGANQAS